MKIATQMLNKVGYVTFEAKNGREALDLLNKTSFDLILMDCQMPEMDGYEATRRIRADNSRSFATIPVIAMTANAMPEERDACIAAGMNEHVSKSFKLPHLVSLIEQYIQQDIEKAS